MSVGAQDYTNMANKAQMVGHTQQLRQTEQVKETEKQRETDKARTENPEASESSGKSVNSNNGAARTANARRTRGDQGLRGMDRLGRGQVEWNEQEDQQGKGWLPPSLQPHSKGAGSANQWNIPYWLMANDEKPQGENPMVAHKKLLNGLRSMVNTEIQQYTKQNEPLYAKKTLREIFSVLNEDGQPAGPAPRASLTVNNDPVGYNTTNIRRAQSAFNMLENTRPEPGDGFQMVA